MKIDCERPRNAANYSVELNSHGKTHSSFGNNLRIENKTSVFIADHAP